MEAVQRMVAEQSSANEGFSDPREGLNDLFRLPQRSEAYPFEAQAWTKELALQMVTHPSAKAVSVGIAPHNLRLAFYGRRLLSLHFQLFLLEASRHAGPAAIAAGGGYFANPIPTRTTGSSENCMSARGDGTAQGLEDALLGDDGVLGRYLGYAWSIKEMANWRYKQGYDSRAVIVQSMVGGLAHAYVSGLILKPHAEGRAEVWHKGGGGGRLPVTAVPPIGLRQSRLLRSSVSALQSAPILSGALRH